MFVPPLRATGSFLMGSIFLFLVFVVRRSVCRLLSRFEFDISIDQQSNNRLKSIEIFTIPIEIHVSRSSSIDFGGSVPRADAAELGNLFGELLQPALREWEVISL
jgi:hypothetical protein